MKYIVADINPFDYNQMIMLFDEATPVWKETVETPRMIDDIIRFAYKDNVFNIKLSGPKLYLNKFVKDILAKERSYYTENKIAVEII